MSEIFALDPRGGQALAERAAENPLDLSQVEPPLFAKTAKGVGLGLMRGGARVGQFVSMLPAAPVALYETATDQQGKYLDPYFKAVDQYANNAVDYWTPTAGEVGKARFDQLAWGAGALRAARAAVAAALSRTAKAAIPKVRAFIWFFHGN